MVNRLASIATMVLLTGCAEYQAECHTEDVVKTTNTKPEVSHAIELSDLPALIKTHKLVVVDVWADWCPYCKAYLPQFQKVANDPWFNKFYFARLNADEDDDIYKTFRVGGLPTTLVFKNTKLVVQLDGYFTASELSEELLKVERL